MAPLTSGTTSSLVIEFLRKGTNKKCAMHAKLKQIPLGDSGPATLKSKTCLLLYGENRQAIAFRLCMQKEEKPWQCKTPGP